MKKILIIGAGFLQTFVIKKAKDMGYYTIAIDKNPQSPGFQYADEYKIIDIVDEEACLKYAISKKIDGVLTAATDYGVLSASYVAKKMNLPGVDYNVASLIKNKYAVRETLFKNKVDELSQYYYISDIKEIKSLADSIKLPVMVKPCDGSGSKGARKVEYKYELERACNEAIKSSLVGKVLIEDFIVGNEFGVESFVYNGEIKVLAIMGKVMTKSPDYAELGHYIPSQSEIENEIAEVVKKAIKVLGINFGAVNMDILVSDDNKIYIIDIGARMGGNLIGSQIIPIGTGFKYMEALIQTALGEAINLSSSYKPLSISTRLLALSPGKIVSLPDIETIKKECQVEIYHYLEPGKVIREYHNNLDGLGYVIATSESLEESTNRAEKAKSLIDKGITRE
ncbi:ATP-grasp domain-containing protein [Priestia aryabhattai]|uniref:ATP-grasp domain-containing protein n=1 Tax=Priestia aryabhattai TaxID=412384 RepID=UPI0005EC988F|nr:ATP-grasp domain-containing protein [Priestia aryabhattai]KJL02161.1 carbamoyl-phosphate synthase large subunit [Priestia aryabhattai B8W22]